MRLFKGLSSIIRFTGQELYTYRQAKVDASGQIGELVTINKRAGGREAKRTQDLQDCNALRKEPALDEAGKPSEPASLTSNEDFICAPSISSP